jgi:uncharacterized membrane protein YtjA (UPF0391 family)
MFRWSLIFLTVAVVAGFFGFSGIATSTTEIARVLFFIFLVLFFAELVRNRRHTD